MKSCKLLPKIVKGSLQIQWKRCGRAGCRCTRGLLHGPYFAIYWRTDGCQVKRYIRLEQLPEALDELQGREARRSVLRDFRAGGREQ